MADTDQSFDSDIAGIAKNYDGSTPDFAPGIAAIGSRYSAPTSGDTNTESYQYIPKGQTASLPNKSIGERLADSGLSVLQAAREGYDNAPYPLKPLAGPYRAAQEALVQAGVNRDIVSIPDAFAGSPGSLTYAGQFIQRAPKATASLAPLADQEPAMVGSGYLRGADTGRNFDVAEDGSVTPVQAPDPNAVTTTPAPQSNPMQPAPSPSNPLLTGPEPNAPSESTAGAQQYTGPAQTMSEGEAKARQAASEGSQLEQVDSDRRVGGIDTHEPVPGVRRTLGVMDLAHAPEEASWRDLNPVPFKAIDNENKAVRAAYFDEGRPGDIAVHNMTEARDTNAVTDLAPMKNDPKPVVVQPVYDLINKQLEDGASDRGFVASALEKVKNTLTNGTDDEGNPIFRTDPNRLYNGARKNITDMLAKAKADPSSDEATAQAHLVEIKNALDGQIADTNPSFRTYLDNYSNASAPIDEAGVLDNIRSKIINANGDMSLKALQQQLTAIDKARNVSSGTNPAIHLTPDSLDRLYNLRDSLQAKAASDDMARVVGSNTHSKILQGQKYFEPAPTPIKNALTNAAEVGLHGAANFLDPTGSGLIANSLIRYGGQKLAGANATRATQNAARVQAAHEAWQQERMDQFTNPKIGHNGGPPLESGSQ